MIYTFKTGKTYRGVDAQTVGDELERIRRASGGRLETAEVVRWAAEESSPIHKCFTWDTEQAARQFNLQEARQLIRSVVIVRETEQPSPAYWNVTVKTPPTDEDQEEQSDQYYQSASVIADNPQEFEAALIGVLRELGTAVRGFEQLRRLAPRGQKMLIRRAAGQVEGVHRQLTELVKEK